MHSNENFAPRQFRIAAQLGPNSVPARTRAALAALGYLLVAPSDEDDVRPGSPEAPALRLVDERLLSEIPAQADEPATPIVLLSTPRSGFCPDPRVIGRAPRPAQLDDLFPILQSALEGTPRRAPRTRVALPARCTQADRRWQGAIVELSTTGCLVESREWRSIAPPQRGSRLNLQFALPDLDAALPGSGNANGSGGGARNTLSTRAECTQLDANHVGLEFCDASDELRARIANYVSATLAG